MDKHKSEQVYYCNIKILNSIFKNKKNGFLKDSMVDDVADFARLSNALLEIGLNFALRDALFETIAGILHLGNIEFVENTEDSKGILMFFYFNFLGFVRSLVIFSCFF